MKYEKLTLKAFAERLKNNGYKNAGGARKSVGKASEWTDAEKKKATAMITAHFGDDAPKAAAPKPKFQRKAKVAPKAKVKAKAAPAEPPKRRGRPPKIKPTASQVANTSTGTVSLAEADIVTSRVGTICQAIMALDKAKQYGVDVKAAVESSATMLMTALNELEGGKPANGNAPILQKFLAATPAPVREAVTSPQTPAAADDVDGFDLDNLG